MQGPLASFSVRVLQEALAEIRPLASVQLPDTLERTSRCGPKPPERPFPGATKWLDDHCLRGREIVEI